MSTHLPIQGIIMAAGKGARMHSQTPKVLHTINDQTLLEHAINLHQAATSQPPLVVIPPNQQIRNLVQASNALPVDSPQALGTGHALKQALDSNQVTSPTIFVTNADDVVLYQPQTINNFIKHHQNQQNLVTFLTSIPDQAYPQVRKVIRNQNNQFTHLAHSETTQEVVCGAYVFNTQWAQNTSPQLKPYPKSGEYGIVDLLEIAAQTNPDKIDAYVLPDPRQWWGVNTQDDLKKAQNLWKELHS